MPDEIEYDDEGNEIEPARETGGMKAAREAAERAEGRAAAAERRAQLLDVLPPIENKALRSMFLDTYKGDITEDAVLGALTEAGLYEAPAPPPEPGNDVDNAAAAARSDLQTGAIPPQETPDPEEVEDPNDLGLRKYAEALKNGRNQEAASAEYFDRVVSAAVRGDKRAIWSGSYTDEQLAGAQ